MNGAAVNCQQEQALHPPHNDTSSLHSPGYLLQTNYPCQEQSSQHQYSKAINYNLLPDNFSVDGSKYSQYIASYSSETRNRLRNNVDIWDDRINSTRFIREPMELPVPNFEVDENSVGVFKYKKEESSLVKDSKDLDLDTRIDLLIKSKALSGMHPIFSDLNESEDSSTDSEELYSDLSKHKPVKHVKTSFSEKHVIHQERFDDPEKPLSRPPSPFLSRATYLFWFNKAIELKQQAKAQEQALLEQATKKLSQGNLTCEAVSKVSNSKQDNSIIKDLLSVVGREVRESIKQVFIKKIIEDTVLSSLEDWWLREKKLEEDNNINSKELSMVSSTTNDNVQSKEGETNEPAKCKAKIDNKVCQSQSTASPKVQFPSKHRKTNEPDKCKAKIDNKVSQGQKSTSPKVLFPSNKNKNQKLEKKSNTLEIQATTCINEVNKTLVKKSDTDHLVVSTPENGSLLCKENDYLETKSINESGSVDDSSFRKINPLNHEEIGKINSINGASDNRNANASNNEVLITKSANDVKNVLKVPVGAEESNNYIHGLTVENLPIPEKPVIEPFNKNIRVEMEHIKSSENSINETVKVHILGNLEDNRVSSKDFTAETNKKEDSFLQNSNKEC